MCTSNQPYVIFSDLDGTLLSAESYDYRPAADMLTLLQERSIPLILCTAKTRAEVEVYRRTWNLHDPFIVEDGAAIFVESDDGSLSLECDRRVNGFQVMELGRPHSQLLAALDEAAQSHRLPVRGFSQVSPEEIAEHTGLSLDDAARAKAREYTETLITEYDDDHLSLLSTALRARGLRLRYGGRFYGVTGDHDKGTAVQMLLHAYRERWPDLTAVGIGDAANDEQFLRLMDRPVLVQRPDGSWADLDIPNLQRVEGAGPVGWSGVVRELLSLS